MADGRRWSDEELRELAALVKTELPSVYQFTNGARKRALINWAAVGGIAVVLGMVQSYLLRPIEHKIDSNGILVHQLQADVRKHHEESPLVYVTRDQYERDRGELVREIRGLRDLIIMLERDEQKR